MIVTKFCLWVGIQDLITSATFGDDRTVKGFGRGEGVEFPISPSICVTALTTLWHYRASVWYSVVYCKLPAL